MHTHLIHTKLGAIEYRSIGTGTPIVFIHGGHSNCQEGLSHKGFDLTKYQLITPSRPGYGQTPLADNKTPKQAADLVIALLQHLELDQVIVYGISAGGLTAIELAHNYPNQVQQLILASAVSKKWLDPSDKTYKTAQKMFHPCMERFIWGMVRFFSGLFPGLIAKSFYPQFSTNPLHKLQPTDIQELVSTMKHYNSKTGFLNDLDQNIDAEALGQVKCPTLVIHSENDASVPFEHALHAHENITHSKLAKLNNEWGHLFWIGADAKVSIQQTLEFIQQNNTVTKP